MFYTIYKITNNLNGKYYIGKHQTKNLNDGYMGSGKLLKRAIKKYGIENFSKEIMFVYKTENEMNIKEKELVTLDESNYNLCPGGHGGFGYVNSTYEIKARAGKTRHKKNPELLQRIAKIGGQTGIKKHGIPKEFVEKAKTSFLGKTHSLETKQKISVSNKGRIPWNKGRSKVN